MNTKIYILILSCVCFLFVPASLAAQPDTAASEGVTAGGIEGETAVEGEEAAQIDQLDPTGLQNLRAISSEPVVSAEEASQYTLGATDIIEILVMRHPEVSGQYVINSEGKIQYEFVGDITVAGLLKEEVAEIIKGRLSEYIVSPEVMIKIIGYNSKVVYVVGEVGAPGKIFMLGDTITVREALVRAGLPLLTGVTKRTRLITPSEDAKQIVRKMVDVNALLYEGDLRENLIMSPGDVLYIPPTFLTKTMRAISPVTAPISNASGPVRTLNGF